ncbi:DNA mismatch repair protein MutS [Thiovibrio frasassiensis]|uniref:DNA mismatch repair protein MutS n=1 Tax=Thiovibrio frasassiensis TaxID=2984131 RepID=A0A9X4MG38_9BACT|nr:DNA mismatch repair protein MutS [Thiovibrio frasassiensis]MDG4475706.1 DNA mismatch repair protein MutS [Thiovibrio frasassiensis]
MAKTTPAPVKITPMMQQYLEIKAQHQDAILFYRLGDFYEMFFDDAVTASKVLGITLTSRNSKDDENRVPLCGIPYHAVSSYLAKMIKAGFKVAICEQVEDPKEAKGIVRREVVRVVTPGLVTDEQLLDDKDNRYLAAICQKGKNWGLSLLDLSTGEFLVSEKEDLAGLLDELVRLGPSEILLPEEPGEASILADQLLAFLPQSCLTRRSPSVFYPEMARQRLLEHFRVANLAGFGCEELKSGIAAAGALLLYLQETQKTALDHIERLTPIEFDNVLLMDESSRRNLELTQTITGGAREGSLLDTLDLCETPMGARLLKKNLLFPLQEVETIRQRLNTVEALYLAPRLREDLRQLLAKVYDLERLNGRVVLGTANGRDLTALKCSLAQLPQLKEKMLEEGGPLLPALGASLDELTELHALLEAGIREDAPVTVREGNLIKPGYHAELDELVSLLRDGKELILTLEARERARTGINNLKIGFNKIFGYYIEISRGQLANVPEDFIRKQTLVNAERFITPELKEFEEKVTGAQEKRLELEYRLFSAIRTTVAESSSRILLTAARLAQIDFFCCLAEGAQKYRYTKPVINSGEAIIIKEGRHPVIERALPPGRFVPNDIHLDQESEEVLIITGPNMAGKSTVLRQTALITLMAQMGSFVPAASAEIGVVDRIFTRVGASDNLRRGQSTFMVEMNETANILNNATQRSLVILDEIGRGTSTFDGLSIAWAVAEELVNKNGRGVKTIFATHYHELTELAATNPRVKNHNIAVREWNDTIIFLHKLLPGGTNRSYGIQVAALAGVPAKVVARAKELLHNIEQGEFNRQGEPRIATSPRKNKPRQGGQLSLFGAGETQAARRLRDINPDTLSPREALDLLYELKGLSDVE